MKRKRRHLTSEFKARVAMDALRGEKTTSELAKEYDIAPTQVSEWKKQLQDRVGDLFDSHGDRSREREAHDRREAQLERKVGQLVIERDFLVKKCEQLGINLPEKL